MNNDEAMTRNDRGLTDKESQLFEEIISATNNREPDVYCRYNFLVYRGALLFLVCPMWGYDDLETHFVFKEIQRLGSIRTATYPCLYLENHRGFMVPPSVLGWHDSRMKFGYENEEERKLAEEAIAALRRGRERKRSENESKQTDKLEDLSKENQDLEDAINSIESPLFSDNEVTYVVVSIIEAPATGVPGELKYTICQTENDAEVAFDNKVKLLKEEIANIDLLGHIDDYGDEIFYYYWCCVLKVPVKLQTSKEFTDFVDSYIEERDEKFDDGDGNEDGEWIMYEDSNVTKKVIYKSGEIIKSSVVAPAKIK